MNRLKYLLILGVTVLSSCAEKISLPSNINVFEIAPSGSVIGGYDVKMTNQGIEYPRSEEFNWVDGMLGPKFCTLGPSFVEGDFYHVPGWEWVIYENPDGSKCMVFEEAEELEDQE